MKHFQFRFTISVYTIRSYILKERKKQNLYTPMIFTDLQKENEMYSCNL